MFPWYIFPRRFSDGKAGLCSRIFFALIGRAGEHRIHSSLEKERLEQFVENYLLKEGYEFVNLKIGGSVTHPVIEIYVDIEGGITVDDCVRIHRPLMFKLAAEGLIDDNTSLIISSPGADRVLKKPADFARFAGRKIMVRLSEQINGRKKITGVLTGFQEGTVHLMDTPEGDIAIAPGRWTEIRLVPEYPEGF